jgi:hypothetical protein
MTRKFKTSERGATLLHDCTDFPLFRQDDREKPQNRSVATKAQRRTFRGLDALGTNRPSKEVPENTVPRLQQHPHAV